MISDFWPVSSRAVSFRFIHATEWPFKGRRYSFNEHLVFKKKKNLNSYDFNFKTLIFNYMYACVSVYGYVCLSTGAKRRPEEDIRSPLAAL